MEQFPPCYLCPAYTSINPYSWQVEHYLCLFSSASSPSGSVRTPRSCWAGPTTAASTSTTGRLRHRSINISFEISNCLSINVYMYTICIFLIHLPIYLTIHLPLYLSFHLSIYFYILFFIFYISS